MACPLCIYGCTQDGCIRPWYVLRLPIGMYPFGLNQNDRTIVNLEHFLEKKSYTSDLPKLLGKSLKIFNTTATFRPAKINLWLLFCLHAIIIWHQISVKDSAQLRSCKANWFVLQVSGVAQFDFGLAELASYTVLLQLMYCGASLCHPNTVGLVVECPGDLFHDGVLPHLRDFTSHG